MTEYDNTNRGAVWSTTAGTGKLDIEGHEFYADVVNTRRDKPSHKLYLTDPGTREVFGTALFKEEDETKDRFASGSIKIDDKEFWVNVFLNKSESDNSPVLDINVKEKEQRPATQNQDEPFLPTSGNCPI